MSQQRLESNSALVTGEGIHFGLDVHISGFQNYLQIHIFQLVYFFLSEQNYLFLVFMFRLFMISIHFIETSIRQKGDEQVFIKFTLIFLINATSRLLILENSTLHKTKMHPAVDFITKLSIFLQKLMKIFLTVILSYKSLFQLKS